MRDLAAAVDLNVASLYHYFPSKRDLLEAVLVEHGFSPVVTDAPPGGDASPDDELAALISDMLLAILDVEDFVRLMLGEAIRGEETARAVGHDLFSNFQRSLESWVVAHRPDLDAASGAPAVARLLRAMVVGIFVEHAAGVLDDGADAAALMIGRAQEAAQILSSPVRAPSPRRRTGEREPAGGP